MQIVREGYNAIAEPYLTDRNSETDDIKLLWELESRIPEDGAVLDVGCGGGVPISLRLSKRFRVTGIDISETQVGLAQKGVPDGRFICANVLEDDLGEDLFDGICSYYAIIHMPRERHASLFSNLNRALKKGGWALLCLGANDLPNWTEEYFGQPMFWSHFDAVTYLKMLQEAGFKVVRHWQVQDGSCPEAKHLFVLAQKS